MQDNQQPVPVYLFLGLLEAGKTQFIQKMLESEQFSTEENVLLSRECPCSGNYQTGRIHSAER